ncbi:MAG: hypothetical protein ACI9TI_001840 [Natronomonas sp.]|jgi:hypothetical protein|uniref:hypothetical protein n=1 Tax=Natronomonas sp. TaxID=2184060 RepID=UPI0039895284
MSRPDSGGDTATVEPKICEYCGTYIIEADQRCPALADSLYYVTNSRYYAG